MWGGLLYLAAVFLGAEAAGAGAARLLCYADSARRDVAFSECTHLVYAGDARGDKLEALLKDYRKASPRAKLVLRVADSDKDFRTLLKSKYVQGLEIHNAHKTLNRTKVVERVTEARTAITSSGGGPLFLALPAHPELLAKYYDLRALMKKVDLMMLQTHALGAVKKMTYHPSRLSGLWDMMNTDSVVDLAVGLGVPASKIVISLPATGQQFTLQNETLSTPGSPTLEDQPKEIGQDDLCRQLQRGRWTLERDQDLSAPYAFKDTTWIAFEDASSVDVKGKYARVRGLGGLALHRADRDIDTPCGPTLKASLAKVLNQQSRAPRAAILRSLENEILSAPRNARALDALQVSPYRITQIVDSDGVIHSIREDTRTEFSCSRQGYFVHPRSCARFYRCVKFDQLSPEYTVFEFDCPTGLAFDSRYEVCVWPGSLPDSQACPGSSEIAPVPHTRFVCPEHEGYYADPENCRWFFACLDHGKAPLTAYEFRCPFGLGFDADRLKCDWPWLVPACGNIARYEAEVHGYSAATLSGAAGFGGQTADSINVAAHQSLISGASLNNLVGIQSGFLSNADALDSNFIASQEIANGAGQYQIGHGGASHGLGLSGGSEYSNGLAYQSGDTSSLGLVQATKYNDGEKYTSGSLILDDYRLPTKKTSGHSAALAGSSQIIGAAQDGISGNYGYSSSHSTGNLGQKTQGYSAASLSNNAGQAYRSSDYDGDNSGAYVHDPSGDYAEPYKHVDSPAEPYNHQSLGYKDSSEYYDYGRYKGSSQGEYNGKYSDENSGQYNLDNSGGYVESSARYKTGTAHQGAYSGTGAYKIDNSGAYNEGNSGSNAYKVDYSGAYNTVNSGSNYVTDNSGAYKIDNSGAYNEGNSGSNAYKVDYSGAYNTVNSGSNYVTDNSGAYNLGYSNSNVYNAENSGAYNADYSGSYTHDNSGQYVAGVYRDEGHIGGGGAKSKSSVNIQSYSQGNAGNYISDSKAYTGSSHTLTAGAVNVGLVGKTTLVDADFNNQNNYQSQAAYTQSVSHQTLHPGQVSYVSQPAVSITHIGTDENNLDGYGYVTTPTSSGVPTTATPFAVTTALPTHKTTFLPEEPKSSIKQIFGYTQPSVTFVKPTVVQQYFTPQLQVNNKQGLGYQSESKDYAASNSKSQSASSYISQSGINYNSQSNGATKEESGYVYSKPSIQFEEGLSHSITAPTATVSSYKPQGFSHSQQTLHKVESVGFQYSNPTPVTEPPFNKLVAYTTTGPAVTTFAQPTVPSYPQSYSHQTLHKVESNNVQQPSIEFGSTGFTSGVTYEQPQTVVQYTTAQPTVSVQPAISTYQPQTFSQQTLHQVDAGRVNTYSQDSSSGYNYDKPTVKFDETAFKYSTAAPTVVQYSTPAPTVVQYSTPTPAVVSTYRPQVYSHQTFHKIESKPLAAVSSTPAPIVHYQAQPTPVTIYQNPILEYTQPKVTPVTFVKSTYQPRAFSHQTIHKSENNVYSTPSVQTEEYEQPKTFLQYTTSAPAIAVQSVVSTYQPQVYSHQVSHKVDTSNVKTYSEAESGYQYSQPSVKFEDTPQSVLTYSTPSPVVSTYKPQSYSHQTIHKSERQKFAPVSTTVTPQFDISQTSAAPVNTYQNPILHYTQKVTPVTYAKPNPTIFTETYQPTVQNQQVSHVQYGNQEASQQSYLQNVQLNQGYSYSQPEIQNVDTARKVYSDASDVSHQTFHLSSGQYDSESQYDSGKDVVFVSTTPSTLVYENHYSDYDAEKNIETFQAPEYIPPKTKYQSSYSVASSAAPVVQQSYIQTQQYESRPVEYSQQYETVQNTAPVQQVSFSTSHVSEPKIVESYHVSSFPGTKTVINYKQSYENPEIQVQYKTEDYLPPVVSTEAPVVSSTYTPRTYSTTTKEYLPPTYSTVSTTREYLPPSTTREYLPPYEPEYKEREYLPPVENTYSTPSTTVRTVYKSTTPSYQYTESTTGYKASEYLPPAEKDSNIVNFESFGFNKLESTAAPKIRYNPYQEVKVAEEVTARPLQRKQNIVVETAKSNLLGFGTVGPDAGLVYPVTYTTSTPDIVSSTSRPIVKSTTQAPYRYVESTTTYKAPEYLPPSDEEVNVESYKVKSAEQSLRGRGNYNTYQQSTYAPVQRKQNIVVQTAKANLAYSSVGSDFGSVSSPASYTLSTPAIVTSTETYTVTPKRVTTTYAPEEQGLFEVTSQAPRRRNKPKVAVVTKINDFNPLLVRKLGAVCSCQSPVLVLKGTGPNTPAPKDFDDYSNDSEDSRGDISDDKWAQKSARLQRPTVTTSPIVSSTFNPIIVPDDSYYQDYQEPSNVEYAVTPKNGEVIVVSTPAVTSTERIVRIRPRVKAVTVAPTYRTVLLNQDVSSTAAPKQAVVSQIESQSFDRYGPGGWRNRDETLQGSVDCQRAGLFRHPKQCNKFYACRWDCTKQRFTLHVFNCPVQLSFDPSLGACNWPSQGPACQGDTLLTNTL